MTDTVATPQASRMGLLAVLLIVAFGLWALYPQLVGWVVEPQAGVPRDTFAGSEALFSALAFAGLLYTIALQRTELALQRKELELTREELRGQKEQLEAQNRSIRFAAETQNLLSLVTFLQTAETREARRAVLTELGAKPYSEWDADDKRRAGLVCSSYDIAAILIRRELVDAEPFLDNWGPSIVRCYCVLEPYIREMQEPSNAGPRYWNDYQWLHQEVVAAYGAHGQPTVEAMV